MLKRKRFSFFYTALQVIVDIKFFKCPRDATKGELHPREELYTLAGYKDINNQYETFGTYTKLVLRHSKSKSRIF